jgi:NADPH:quinone reductase
VLQKVVRSAVIDAPIERVWAVLRDFNSHDRWHTVVDKSRIEGNERSDQVGCVRSFTLKDGNRIREQLLSLDDREHKSSYCIVEATVPLQRYVAHVTLKPVTDGNRTFWHWESSFATPPGRERELRQMVAEGVYEAGFQNLRAHLQQRADLLVDSARGRARGSATAMPSALPVASQRVVVERYGEAAVMRSQAHEVPAPGPGEVRIRQRAIGVNYFDIYLRLGWIPGLLPLPGTPGQEAAGSVLDVGDKVLGLLPGDRVAYLGPTPGAYCSVRNVPAEWVLRLPPAVEDDVAAALLLKGITADYLLRDLGRVGRGTRLLVHAAAGGVGQLLEDKARVARAHGCENVIVTRDYRFAEAVQALCGGADVVVDGLGQAAAAENLAALARRGHWISLGQASGPLQPVDPQVLTAKSLSFSAPVAFDYMATPTERRERSERLWAALADGTLPPPQIERHALASAADAHERLESRRSTGSLVLIA